MTIPHSMINQGQARKGYNIFKRGQGIKMHQLIEHENRKVYGWFIRHLEHEAQEGT
jgi:hypothetical protein